MLHVFNATHAVCHWCEHAGDQLALNVGGPHARGLRWAPTDGLRHVAQATWQHRVSA
jgi:hypothetical protein